MIADTLHTTLYEGWEEGGYGSGSTNHAWSGGMLTVIAEQVCGIRPLAPGWQAFEVAPYPVIGHCQISIPSVRGLISAAYTDSEKQFSLQVVIPTGITARIVLPDAAYNHILLNGKTTERTALTLLRSGTYEIIAEKTKE